MNNRQTEMLRIMMNDSRFNKASEILKNNGLEFTIFSCTEDVLKRLLEGDKKIIEYIKIANDKEIYIEEVERDILEKLNKKDVVEEFFSAFEKRTTERLFLIIGEAGVGKTYTIEKRLPNIYSIPCNKGLDSFTMLFTIDPTTKAFIPTEFQKAMIEGRKVWLDEINELPHDSLMLLQGITDEKQKINLGTINIDIHPDFKIIGTMNPPSETDERTPLGDALLSRAVGLVMELTDDIIMERLKVSKGWLQSVRRLYSYIKQSGMVDVRELTYRDYQRFLSYDFETQLKFKVCMGDISNIKKYNSITETGEYKNLVSAVKSNETNKRS
jgi:hypothetical protein